jgi:hypothetical protein
MPQPQVFAVADHGQYFSVDELNDTILRDAEYQATFDSAAWVEDIDDSESPTAKDVLFDRIVDLSTMIAPEITEFGEVPRADFTISRGTLTRTWRALAVDYSTQLQHQGKIKVKPETQRLLRKSIQLTCNYYAWYQYNQAYLRYTPTGTAVSAPTRTLATTGTCATAATRNVEAWDIRQIWEDLQNLRVEGFDATTYDYVCICHPAFLSALRADATFRADWRDADPKRLVRGWEGDYEGLRFVIDNHVLNNILGTTAYKADAVVFGRRPIYKSVLMEPEIRGETISGTLGLQNILGWVGALGWKYPYGAATAGRTNVLVVDST